MWQWGTVIVATSGPLLKAFSFFQGHKFMTAESGMSNDVFTIVINMLVYVGIIGAAIVFSTAYLTALIVGLRRDNTLSGWMYDILMTIAAVLGARYCWYQAKTTWWGGVFTAILIIGAGQKWIPSIQDYWWRHRGKAIQVASVVGITFTCVYLAVNDELIYQSRSLSHFPDSFWYAAGFGFFIYFCAAAYFYKFIKTENS